MAKAVPDDREYAHGVSVAYEKLGDNVSATGKAEHADLYYQRSLGIREALRSESPERADYQGSLGIAYAKLGLLMRTHRQFEPAREYFEKSLAIAELLLKAEPERVDYQRGLAVSCSNLGDALMRSAMSNALATNTGEHCACSRRSRRTRHAATTRQTWPSRTAISAT